MNKELKAWRKLLAEDWLWFRKRGASLVGYIARYGRAVDPEPTRFGEGGEAIYAADLAALRRKIDIVTDLAKKRGNPSRRFIPRCFVRDDGRMVQRV